MADTKTTFIDEEEYNAALEDAKNSDTSYKHKFKKPLMHDGEEINEVSFDFDSLTGLDAIGIEAELALKGKAVVAPEFSTDYLILMAVKVSSPKIGLDAFKRMGMRDYNKIRGVARSFLLG